MKNTRSKTASILLLTLFGSMLILGAASLGAQDATQSADPFYLKLLSDGERSFHAQNFQEAARSLKVAIFGLGTEKTLQGKALGYLCLSYFNLKDDAKAKDCLLRVIDLVGLSNLSGLAMEDPDRVHLGQVAAFFKLDQPTPGTTTPSRTDALASTRPAAPGTKKETPAETIKALEKKIKDNPKSVQAYLDLYEFQKQQKNAKAAGRALEDLIKKVPADPAGPFLLGKLRYAAKDYDETSEYMNKALALMKTPPAPDKDLLEAQAYLILSYDALKKKPLLAKACRDFLGRGDSAAVPAFDLADKDKSLVVTLLEQSQKGPVAKAPAPVAAPAGAPGQDAANIQKEIKKNPRDAALYYGLYDLYLQKRDKPAARQTLQNLIKNSPLEAKAYLTLGELCYEDKDYGKSSETLRKMLNLPKTVPVDDNLRAEAAFYLTLSDYLNKDKEPAFETYSFNSRLIQSFLDGSPVLSDPDLIIWQNIRRAVEAAPRVYLADVRLEKPAAGLEVKIILTGPTAYRTFILTKEKSIIIELFHVTGSKAPGTIEVNARGVKAVKAGMYQKDTARVTLEGLKQVPSHRIVKTDEGLSIIIE
jgi:tetratricopeptide (TPR) repeat protein